MLATVTHLVSPSGKSIGTAQIRKAQGKCSLWMALKQVTTTPAHAIVDGARICSSKNGPVNEWVFTVVRGVPIFTCTAPLSRCPRSKVKVHSGKGSVIATGQDVLG